jgi:isopenicillin-N epimerase
MNEDALLCQSPEWAELAAQWRLEPGVTYLNHGSFGPAPQPVLAERAEWFARLERQPMEVLTRQLVPGLERARQALAGLVHCQPEDLVLVDNATMAMNVVAGSVPLGPGDEVLLTDHEYGAVQRLWRRRCERAGARLVLCRLPLPFSEAEEVVESVLAAVTPRTRLAVFSHVTSPTAVVLPAAQLCRALRGRGVATCIDGPHAVAMQTIDLCVLGCDYYCASCHKWLCAPFGTGFLYVHPQRQGEMEPLVISWGRTPEGRPPSWQDEFYWWGTRDPSAWLSIPAAIAFLAAVGWDRFRSRTHALARYARRCIERLTGLPAFVPDSEQWYGSMIAMPLPPLDAAALQQALWCEEQIEVPIIEWQAADGTVHVLVRPSCHLYTTPEHIDRLCAALARHLRR